MNDAHDFMIIPAIDLKGGRCVRLRQGRAEDETVYGDDPVAMARRWQAEGARYLHVVDLDGAFRGKPAHIGEVAAIVGALDIPVEVGGGLRTDEDIQMVLDCGVDRVIIGTRAVEDPDAIRATVGRYGPQIAVGIDARDGWVQVKGWVETSQVKATELAADVAAMGVQTIIYTDVATDGMLSGPNVAAVADVCAAVPCKVVASGGVSAVAHAAALRDLGCANLCGAIVGKALYDGAVTLAALEGIEGDVV